MTNKHFVTRVQNFISSALCVFVVSVVYNKDLVTTQLQQSQ
jgi:hypothetical protein